MSLESALHSLQSIGFLAAFRGSAIVYPIVMSTHLACIAVFGGMILMTDLRLLGWALKDYSVSSVVEGLKPWKRLGGAVMLTAGLLLGSSEADKYYPNPYFWIKLTLLVLIGIHALIFRPLVYNKAREFDGLPALPAVAKTAAALSMVLWIGVLTMGRLIGYWEPKRENAQVNFERSVFERQVFSGSQAAELTAQNTPR
jgi:hypothetical protein